MGQGAEGGRRVQIGPLLKFHQQTEADAEQSRVQRGVTRPVSSMASGLVDLPRLRSPHAQARHERNQHSKSLVREAFRPNSVTATVTTQKNSYGSTAVMFRLGTCPTGMRVTSFIDLMSTTDTEFDPAFAT